jgi:hypothetical protein
VRELLSELSITNANQLEEQRKVNFKRSYNLLLEVEAKQPSLPLSTEIFSQFIKVIRTELLFFVSTKLIMQNSTT